MLERNARLARDINELDRKLALARRVTCRARWGAGRGAIMPVQKAAYASCRTRADEYAEDIPPVH